jgi:hypothetical protein
MPSKADDKDTKKTTKKPEEKKPAYHNFLIVDHSLRPGGFHLCNEEPSK